MMVTTGTTEGGLDLEQSCKHSDASLETYLRSLMPEGLRMIGILPGPGDAPELNADSPGKG